MSPNDFASWATVFNAVATAIIAIAALVVSVLIWRLTKISQQHNIVLQCNFRYDNLIQMKYDVLRSGSGEAFWERFWALQQDQFNHWRDELIPDKIFIQWQIQRKIDFEQNVNVHTTSYRTGWNYFQSRFSGIPNDFVSFTSKLHQAGWSEDLYMSFKSRVRTENGAA